MYISDIVDCFITACRCCYWKWVAGANADGFEDEVSAEELQSVLQESPWRERIPEILRSLKQRLKGESQMRLSSV